MHIRAARGNIILSTYVLLWVSITLCIQSMSKKKKFRIFLSLVYERSSQRQYVMILQRRINEANLD